MINTTYGKKVRVLRIGLVIGLLVILEAIARFGIVPPTQLVPPTEIAVTLGSMLAAGTITPDILGTVFRVVVAFVAAILLGIPIGWMLWKSTRLWQILDPYLIVLYAMPIFVFYPILIVMFGLGSVPIILIAFAMSITGIIISTATGLDKVPKIYFDVGHALNLSRRQFVMHVQLPAAVPYIFTGLKLGLIYSFVGVIASEFILSNSGLGFLVSWYYDRFATAEMYASIVAIMLIATIVNTILVQIEDHLYKRSVR
jgi:NitT/TauT family transport system permease protein